MPEEPQVLRSSALFLQLFGVVAVDWHQAVLEIEEQSVPVMAKIGDALAKCSSAITITAASLARWAISTKTSPTAKRVPYANSSSEDDRG